MKKVVVITPNNNKEIVLPNRLRLDQVKSCLESHGYSGELNLCVFKEKEEE